MGRKRYLVYFGIFALITLNFIDRVALSIAAPSIAKEFDLSAIELGYLFSSYNLTYLLFLIPLGFLTDRHGAKMVNTIGVAFWSVATFLTGVVSSFGALIGLRLLMGAAEASSYPAGGRALRDWAPRSEFGLAATLLNSGGYAGPALGMMLLGWVVSISNWRYCFYTAGTIGAVWLLGWMIWYKRPEVASFLEEKERSFILRERSATPMRPVAVNEGGFGALLRSRTMLGIAVAQGCAVYTQHIFLTWMPSYLVTEKHLSIMKTGMFTALPYLVATVLSWILANVSDRLLSARGGAATGQRRLSIVCAMLAAGVILLAPWVNSVVAILILLTISLTGLATGISLNIALTSDLLESPQDAGKAMAIQICGGNIFGIAAPIVTGYIIAMTGSYNAAFVVGGLLLLFGATLILTLTHSPIRRGVVDGRRASLKES